MHKYCKLLCFAFFILSVNQLHGVYTGNRPDGASDRDKQDQEDQEAIRFPLHMAIRSGDIARVKELVTAGSDLEKKLFGTGSTPLIEAIKQGSAEMVNLLLNAGADVNATDWHLSPLHQAIDKQDELMVQLLLEKKANLNVLCYGSRPIHQASTRENVKILQMLLESKVDQNALNAFKESPLCCAAKVGKSANIQILFAHGANIGSGNSIQQTALVRCAEENGYFVTGRYIRLLPAFKQGLNVSLRAFAMILHPRCTNSAIRQVAPCTVQAILEYLNPKVCVYQFSEVEQYARVAKKEHESRRLIAANEPERKRRKIMGES